MYEVKISKKSVKNIIIKVRVKNLVEVVSPRYITNAQITKILEQKQDWIKQRLIMLDEEKSLKNGDFIQYLGKDYKLKIISSDKNCVNIQNDELCVYMIDDFKGLEALLDGWYKDRAKEVFSEILARFCVVVGKDIKALKVRKMKTRWGSCNTSKSYINLNSELVKKPPQAIEAVIMHELVHLYHANHSKAFYDKLISFMPDYYERIKLLKNKEF